MVAVFSDADSVVKTLYTAEDGISGFDRTGLIPAPYTLREIKFNKNLLGAAQPFIKGFGMVLPIKMPNIMNVSVTDKAWTVLVWKMLINFIKGFEGMTNLSLQRDELQMGGDGNVLQASVKTEGIPKDFTLTLHSDLATAPISKYMTEWLMRINNPYTNRAYDNADFLAKTFGGKLRYGEHNHTAEFLIISTDPTMTRVLDYAYFSNCAPSEGKRDFMNFTRGENSTEELSIPFTGRLEPYNVLTFAAAQAYVTALGNLDKIDLPGSKPDTEIGFSPTTSLK